MTPKRAKKLLPIIQAFVKGKTIQARVHGWSGLKWNAVSDPKWLDTVDYRIKPKPRRPKP